MKSSKCGWIFTDDLSANILPSLLFNSQNWPAFCEVTGKIKVALFQLSVANCLFFLSATLYILSLLNNVEVTATVLHYKHYYSDPLWHYIRLHSA